MMRIFFNRLGNFAAQEKKPKKNISKNKLSAPAAAIEKFIVEEIEIGGVPAPAITISERSDKLLLWWLDVKPMAACLGLWLLVLAASLLARNAWPVDETRMLAVTWEMWTRQELLVPILNGGVYAQAPLMPWLIQAGWLLFGVNDWWPRWLPALFALASLVITYRVARLLWRENPDVARYAPLILTGMPCWALYTTLALPDMLLVFFTLLAWWALLIMWRGRDMRAFLLLGLALGLGTLALGTAIFLYILPLAWFAPLWARGKLPIVWKYWYADVAKAIAIAAGMVLCWLVPAAMQTGWIFAWQWFSESFISARLDLFPMAQPWWWYVAWMPVALLPWSLWPLMWMRLWHMRREAFSAGMAFCFVAAFSMLGIFSLLETKQPQFMLPLLPLTAVFMAHLLTDKSLTEVGEGKFLSGMTMLIVLLGAVLAVLPRLPRLEFLPELLWELSPFVGVGVMLLGIALAWLPLREVRQRFIDMVVASNLLVVFVLLGVASQFDVFYRLDDAAGQFLANAQAHNQPIAHVGAYQGEFQFSARLPQPLDVIEATQAEEWLMKHTDGLLVAYAQAWQPRASRNAQLALETAYRGNTLRVWRAMETSARNP